MMNKSAASVYNNNSPKDLQMLTIIYKKNIFVDALDIGNFIDSQSSKLCY